MCGINGYIGDDPTALDTMNTVTAHRGPDFAGTYHHARVHLGHRLLAIRDASEASRQPVSKPGSPWVLIFNGQIYNTQALSDSTGVKCHDLDTAMIFELIEKVGWEFVHHLQGMFAIALYNEKENVLKLYRDSGGQKPIYYTHNGNEFVFSSEIKAILAHGAVSKEVDRDALHVAQALGYIPGTATLFKNIRKVDAGQIISVAQGKLSYHRIRPTATHLTGSPRDAIQQTVFEHLASKQKVALNLSGGLDSSILLHEMKEAGHELLTYTTTFDKAGENFNDDAVLAKKLSQDYHTLHTEVVITPDSYLEHFVRAYESIEEPNYNISLPSYLQIAEREGMQGDHNRVILSGNGGDEIFGGYRYYAESLRYNQLEKKYGATIFNTYKWLRTGTWWDYANPVERWLSFKYFKLDVQIDQHTVSSYIKNLVNEQEIVFGDSVRDMMLLDRALWMPGENFMQADKLFMTQSLEMRAPFAYEPLRQYFDARLKSDDYIKDGSNKQLVRDTYRGLLPDYIIDRKAKTGWRSPVRPWYASDKRFKELFLNIIKDAPRGGTIPWNKLAKEIEKRDDWPGKYMFVYLSLAILAKNYDLVL